MRFDRTLLSVLCAVVLVSPCYAERRQDDGNDGSRDDSLWSETESQTYSGLGKSKCGISEKAGKIRIDSKKGKGGSAAYLSAWTVDWTDSFVIEFEHELKSSRPSKTSQSATSGMALGFGARCSIRLDGWRECSGVSNEVRAYCDSHSSSRWSPSGYTDRQPRDWCTRLQGSSGPVSVAQCRWPFNLMDPVRRS